MNNFTREDMMKRQRIVYDENCEGNGKEQIGRYGDKGIVGQKIVQIGENRREIVSLIPELKESLVDNGQKLSYEAS